MKSKQFIGSVAILALSFAQVAFAMAPSNVPGADAPGQTNAALHAPVCAHGNSDTAHCHARILVDKNGKPQNSQPQAALGPAQLLGAYNLSGIAPNKQIIAIVDAYGDTNALSDLNTYSAKFGIPAMGACVGAVASSATPCFSKVDQHGGTNYPAVNAGWALETSLDIEVAHAICQNCSILLVQSNSAGFSDLMQAVDTAVALGANEISNSYGANEFLGENTFDSHFNHPGIAITVSSGDSGYGVEYPAASPFVTSVGGTSLTVNSNNTYNSETVWNGAGSGCSSQESQKPVGQPSIGGCLNRVVADVSAVADPNTGAAVYDSTPYNGASGWFKVGGTSLASPLIAAAYALAGGVPTGVQGNTLPYAHASALHDITSGSNGSCGTGRKPVNSALCIGTVGFDGPTGLGTPNGIGAF
jgi:subtilase family serine protease